MNDIAIRAENLSKLYQIGALQTRPDSLRETLTNFFRRSASESKKDTDLWALKDISFEVSRGEVIGVVGHNGSGKSTLLKLLSRITEPTTGRATIHGRVGSLLEVGTGFHPELTGRENIYMNGAMLGMKRAEINRKFDEIVAFAEIEKFIDTPVKRYSSGMYVRLAFAVAAHLEPEILLVDEVLAVGDIAFQRKCLGKMEDVAKNGRTILFVSHNTAAVENLCTRTLLLQEGHLRAIGKTTEVLNEYLYRAVENTSSLPYHVNPSLMHSHQTDGSQQFVIENIELLDLKRNPVQDIATGDSFVLRLHYQAKRKFVAPAFEISIRNQYGIELIQLSTMPMGGYFIESLEGPGTIELVINELPLLGGLYLMTVGVARAYVEWIVQLENVVSLNVSARDVYHSGLALDNNRGFFSIDHQWALLPMVNRQLVNISS
ncbi:MAG: ABC transporter ATP-binding protein [Chloroflexota bacterium]